MADVKSKKKKFVQIIAPRQFHEQVIGESLVADPRLLLGRKIKVNMMSLTDNPKNQNIQIKFHINNLKGENVSAEIIGFTLLPAFVKRLVRKDKKRVDDCFKAQTSDNKKLTLKTFLLTLNKTSKSVLKALRKQTQETLKDKVSKISYDELLKELFSHQLQNETRKKLGKVYPLRQCEIRDLQVISEKKHDDEEQVKVEKPAQKQEEKTPKKEEKPKEETKAEKKEAKPEEKPKEKPKEEKNAKTDN
ncbi:hypothetical protein CEE44_05155 [Candidatus Woesearchaeota archaeon B3_Woes]|nr:MAG: hypothetical protein CEE44_05155 [Candidatus Woesearchaeota archaeon B3_Woes]